MSKLTRVLILGAMLAAMNLAGLTTVAHAQVHNEGKNARRPPTQDQIGKARHQRQLAPDAPNATGHMRPPTERQVGEPWRHQTNVPTRPTDPGGQSSRPMAAIGLLAAVLALAGGLAVLAVRRTGRRTRVGQMT
jgi:hypothetical protein